MPVIVRFAVAERSSEMFNTAVFRFMELKMSRVAEEPIIRMANMPERGWERKELEFASEDVAREFRAYVERLHLGLQTTH